MIYVMSIRELSSESISLEAFTTWRDLIGRFQDFVGNTNYHVTVRAQEVSDTGNIIILYMPQGEA